MHQESTLIPVKSSSKGTRLLAALDHVAHDFDLSIIRDDMCFDDEHTIVDLSAILKLVITLANNNYNYNHLFDNPDQLTLF